MTINNPIDWQEILFNPENDLIGRLDRLAKKRFYDENVADEAFIWVLGKIKNDNWSRLERFDERAKPSTFLHTVFVNLLHDFSRYKFGYPRPKKWLQNMGDLWIEIWRRLCLERESKEQIKIQLADTNKVLQAEIARVMVAIKAKEPNCGADEGLTSIGAVESEQQNEAFDREQLDNKQDDLSSESNADTLEQVLSLVGVMAGLNQQKLHNSGLTTKAEQLALGLNLDSDEQLLIKLKYQQCMSNAAIARAMDSTAYKVQIQHTDLMGRINTVFVQQGIYIEELFS